MKRRAFLLGAISLPAAPILPKIPAAAPGASATIDAMASAAWATLLEAAERAVNPLIVVDENGAIHPIMTAQLAEQQYKAYVDALVRGTGFAKWERRRT